MGQTNPSDFQAHRAAVIVAHPDDETLWAGGTILARPHIDWFVATLCRAGDVDRAPKFAKVLECLHARGAMANLDDGPEQTPLPPSLVERTIRDLLPTQPFDLLLTHGPAGEYTRHRRHEEVCRAVVTLWEAGQLTARHLWMFAYDDDNRQRLPQARADAYVQSPLAESLWREKYRLIVQVYGFSPASWEARTTPRHEAFWQFDSPLQARRWLEGWETLP